MSRRYPHPPYLELSHLVTSDVSPDNRWYDLIPLDVVANIMDPTVALEWLESLYSSSLVAPHIYTLLAHLIGGIKIVTLCPPHSQMYIHL